MAPRSAILGDNASSDDFQLSAANNGCLPNGIDQLGLTRVDWDRQPCACVTRLWLFR